MYKVENEILANKAERMGRISVDHLPVKLTLHTNKHCNLTCGFCGYSSKHRLNPEDIMSRDVLDRVAAQVFPTSSVVIPTTYGEPLIYEDFDYLVQLVRSTGNKLSMYTNGVLLTRDRLISLMDILNDLKLSFDGATISTYEKLRTLSEFEVVLSNLEQFQKLKKEIKFYNSATLTFQFTMMRSNISELPEFVDLVNSVGGDRIAVSHVYAFHANKHSELLIEEAELSNQMLKEARSKAIDLGIEFFSPKMFDTDDPDFSEMFSYNTCSYLYQETWIDAKGDVRPCFFPDGPVLGNILKTEFSEIWNGKGYQKMRETINDSFPFYKQCSKCPIRMQFSKDQTYHVEGFIQYDQEFVEDLEVVD